MIRKVSFAAFAFLSCTAAVAASDNRIRTLAYDSDQIVRIVGRAGIQSTIQFGADERIENVAVGDSSAWQITPNRRASLLFVKPLNAHSRTNMTVVTDRRTYMFDLVAGDKGMTAVYALKFTYPNEKPLQPIVKPAQSVAVAASEGPAALAADKLHFDWKTKGNGKLVPNRVFDDGTSLYLAWRSDTPLPAILTRTEDRQEGPVNYRISGDYIVISPIPANLVLRYGKREALLWSTRPIAPPVRVTPNAFAGRMAEVSPPPAQTETAPVPTASSTVKLANVTALYTDQLTDTRHEH